MFNQILEHQIRLTSEPVPSDDLSPAKELQDEMFAHGPALPGKAVPALSGLSMGSVFMASDYTSLYRSFQDTAECFKEFAPFFDTKGIALGYHAFGSASGINTLIGLVQMKRDFENLAYTDAIGDKNGSLMNRLSLAKGGILTGAGVSFAIFRPVSMAAAIKEASATSLLGRVGYGALFAGLSFYAIFFAIFSVIFGIKLHEGSKFEGELAKAEGLEGQIEVLQKKIGVEPKAVLKRLVEKTGSEEAARDALIDEAFDGAKAGIKSLMKELGILPGTDESMRRMVKRIVAASCEGKSQEEIEELVQAELMVMGLQMKVQKESLKNESELSRLLGGEGMEALKELASGRVSIEDPDGREKVEALVEKVRAANKSNMKETSVVLAVFVAGVVAMILPLILVSGPGLVVSSVVMLLFSVVMTGVDGFYLLQSYKGERPAEHDKKMLIFSSLVGLASLLSVVALGFSGVVTLGTFPMVFSLTLVALWLAQNGATWVVMQRNERRYHEENPTLVSFQEFLESGRASEKVMEVFANLDGELQAKIQEELEHYDGDMKRATGEVIRQMEQLEHERRERLREALMPFLVDEVQ